MSPFKIPSKVKKKLGKIDRKDNNLNYSLQPFVSKWLRDHPPELSYALKPPEMNFETWKQQIKELILNKIPTLEPLPFNKQQLKIYGETTSIFFNGNSGIKSTWSNMYS